MSDVGDETPDPILTAADLPTLYRVREFATRIIGTVDDDRTNRMYMTALVAAEKIIYGLEDHGRLGERPRAPG